MGASSALWTPGNATTSGECYTVGPIKLARFSLTLGSTTVLPSGQLSIAIPSGVLGPTGGSFLQGDFSNGAYIFSGQYTGTTMAGGTNYDCFLLQSSYTAQVTTSSPVALSAGSTLRGTVVIAP